VDLACNLDKRTQIILPDAAPEDVRKGTWSIDKTIYDTFGNTHKMRIDFTRVAGVENQWQGAVTIDPDAEIPTNTTAGIGEAAGANTFIVTFSNLGVLQSAVDTGGTTVNNGVLTVNVGFDASGNNA